MPVLDLHTLSTTTTSLHLLLFRQEELVLGSARGHIGSRGEAFWLLYLLLLLVLVDCVYDFLDTSESQLTL